MNFTGILENWYKKNKRDLPWRKTKDPYRIWVSEIILQQTRIEQGWDYYLRFLQKFPDIKALAETSEETVLKIWQGLGYYSRARNMHAAAKQIIDDHGGIFPSTYEEIRKLKGIGDYTAAAISSISFGIPAPVVDGNVLRFFSRFFGINEPVDTQKGKSLILLKATEHINVEHPGDFNQSIMEYGALQCKPAPDCKTCPLRSGCFAFQQNKVTELPVKLKNQVQRTRYFHYLLITIGKGKKESIYLKKRTEKDIWKNLFDFPIIETEKNISLKKLMKMKEWQHIFQTEQPNLLEESKLYRHVLTHQIIIAKFYHLEFHAKVRLPFVKVAIGDLEKYPVPRLIEMYLQARFITAPPEHPFGT
jgi:A/G-specific adenine glycosylase